MIYRTTEYKQSNWEGSKYCHRVPSLDCQQLFVLRTGVSRFEFSPLAELFEKCDSL